MVVESQKLKASGGADQTRAALVRAALILFGEQGFEGTSTREIAAAANANIGSIAYHFGSKEGLRIAVADHIVATIQAIASRNEAEAVKEVPASQDASLAITAMIERMFSFFVVQQEAAEIVPFVLREMAAPSPAFERIYAGMIEPIHKRCCDLWEAATGEPAGSEETRINVFTVMGQIIYFRLAREAVRRRMGWADIDFEHGAKISKAITSNVADILAAKKERTS
ncbi:MAG: CerR family C-terminal domain-containing protein [Rhizobiaceae bacterium]|nr:CerR family C-terminal domain-containing protein [Rhizobiaceae bacterium]